MEHRAVLHRWPLQLPPCATHETRIFTVATRRAVNVTDREHPRDRSLTTGTTAFCRLANVVTSATDVTRNLALDEFDLAADEASMGVLIRLWRPFLLSLHRFHARYVSHASHICPILQG